MSFYLAYASDAALLSSTKVVIKRNERVAFGDALALLRETTMLRERACKELASARDAARLEGLSEAREAAHETLTTGLAEIAHAIAAHVELRRADIAEAAFAAARAIIGEFEDSTVMQRIIDRIIARLDGDKPVTIEVAPTLVDGLGARLIDLKHVAIVANPDFGPTDCRVLSVRGQIVASLSVQFDALAARWGL